MVEQVIQPSFNSGEWSPKLYARVDLAKYRSGAALLENFFVDYRGGASTRAGTKYVLQCYKSATAVRLIPFQASFDVGYVLEFGDQYIRFFYQGAPVLEAATVITAALAGSPVTFTDAGHGYTTGNWIFVGNKYYIVQVLTANTYSLTDLFGNAINTNPFVLPANAQRVYTITTPYAAADLRQIKFAQNVNVLVLCHPNYAPRILTLVTATNWTLNAITFGTPAVAPTALGYTTNLLAGQVFYEYRVSTVDANDQESQVATLAFGPLQDLRTVAGSIVISWTAAAGASSYNVYKTAVNYNGVVPTGQIAGYIGQSTSVSFTDDNIGPDFSITQPVPHALFGSAGNYPAVPGFFQQRLVLAATTNGPQTFWMSQTGKYYNFNTSVISQDTDAITGSLVSGQLNTIKAMLPQTTGLLMFTDRNSWLINGGGNQTAVTPSALVASAQSFNGLSDVPPIVANFDVLYVQAKGSIIRDSSYNIYANVFTGTDISAISSHLFYGHTVDEWAWAEEPFKVVWAIRDDGVMLTLTFLKEQEFIGWAHSNTNGSFKSVCTVVESTTTAGEIDAVYTVVERSINGQTLQYVERIAERSFTTASDAWCVDAGIQYSGAPTTNFSGAEFLAGETVTGLADGEVIPPFVMPTSGDFTLSAAASKVTIGLAFTAKLQTLPIELGEPTVQGKVKKINSVDVRVADTLNLQIGPDFSHLVDIKDFRRGNVSSMLTGLNTSQVITDLVTGDSQTYLAAGYTVPGQYCIQQSDPLPATILGVIPNITVGEDGRRG